MKKLSLFLLTLVSFLFVGMLMPNVYADEPAEKVDFKLTVVKDDQPLDEFVFEADFGQVTSINLEGLKLEEKIAFFVHNNQIIPSEDNPEFIISGSTNLTVVIKETTDKVALFMDTNGELLDFKYNPENIPTTLVAPTKPGYDFSGFDTIKIIEDTIFVAEYTLNNDTPINITVDGGSIVNESVTYNDIVTVMPDDIENFSHWEEFNSYSDEEIISFDVNYRFSALKDISIRAVYLDEPIQKSPLVYLKDVSGIRTDYESYLAQIYLPNNDYEIIEFGYIMSNTVPIPTLESLDIVVKPSQSLLETTNEYLISIPNAYKQRYIRAYVILKYDNQLTTVLSTTGKHSVDVKFNLWVNEGWNPRPTVHIVGNFTNGLQNKILMTKKENPDNDYFAVVRIEWFGNYENWFIASYKYQYNNDFLKPDEDAYVSYFDYAIISDELEFVGGH